MFKELIEEELRMVESDELAVSYRKKAGLSPAAIHVAMLAQPSPGPKGRHKRGIPRSASKGGGEDATEADTQRMGLRQRERWHYRRTGHRKWWVPVQVQARGEDGRASQNRAPPQG